MLEGIHALVNKIMDEWLWLVFHLLPNRYGRDLRHRTHLDGFHILIIIVTVEVFSIFTSYPSQISIIGLFLKAYTLWRSEEQSEDGNISTQNSFIMQ